MNDRAVRTDRSARGWIAAAATSWRPILLAHAAVLAVCAVGLPRLGLDNSPQVYFVEDAEELERYREFQHLFGRDHLLRVVVEGRGLWTDAGVAWLAELEQELARTRDVVGAAGLWTHHRILPERVPVDGPVDREPADEDLESEPTRPGWPPGSAQELRRRATADPLDLAAGWVSGDGEVTSVLVVLYDLSPERQRRVIAAVREAAADPPPGVSAHVLGLPVVAESLDRKVLEVAVRTYPPLLVWAVAMLLATLRSLRALVAPLAFVGYVQTVVLGLMGFAGVRVNVVLMVLVPLLFVISLATTLYLLVEYRHRVRTMEGNGDRQRALVACYRERGWPVVWAGITTAAGFGSLLLAGLPPVRALGLWTAAGIALATAEAFLLYPALLQVSVSDSRDRSSLRPFEVAGRRLGRSLAELAIARPRPVVLAFALLALGASLALPRLDVGPGPLDFFAPSDPVRTEIESLEKRGIAVVAGELTVSVPETDEAASGPFAQPDGLRALDRLAAELRSLPGVLSVLTPYDFVVASARARREGASLSAERRDAAPSDRTVPTLDVGAPPSDAELRSGLEAFRARTKLEGLLAAMLTRDDRAARITVTVPMVGIDELEPIFERAVEDAGEHFPGAHVSLSGVYPLVLQGQRAILETMGSSLLLTLAVFGAILGVLTRSVRGVLACLLPNLLAVLFVVGLMAATGVPLDSTTLMIAAVVLGLAVDDTLHTLGAFRRRAGPEGAGAASIAALEHTATGHLLTTATLVGGFLVCGLSGFVPVARFGLLTAAALVVALAADLLLTPVLLASLGPTQVEALRPPRVVEG